MMSTRTTQKKAVIPRTGGKGFRAGTLTASVCLMGVMMVMQMMRVVPDVYAATSTTVNLSAQAKVTTCEFTLSDAAPKLTAVDASAIRFKSSVELGYVTLTLSNCAGSLAGTNKALKVTFSGSTQKSLGGTVRYDEYLFRDSSSIAKNVGFALKWNSTTAHWASVNVTGPTMTADWPSSKNADLTVLGKGANKSVNVAYALSSGENQPATVKAGTVKATITITMSVA